MTAADDWTGANLRGATTNLAGRGARVGLQTQAVHGDVRIELPADASPQEKYDRGVFWLNGGVPEKASQLIEEAIAGGLKGSEVGFHWLLAQLSGKTLHQLPEETLSKLRAMPEHICRSGGDVWSDGLEMVLKLLGPLNAGETTDEQDADLRAALKGLDGLATEQRTKILRHLELFLEGPLQEQLWDRAVGEAERQRWERDRVGRAWMFFHPEPAPPRVRPPHAVSVDQVVSVAAAIPCAAMLIYLGWVVVSSDAVSGALGYLLTLLGGYAWARGSLAVHVGAELVRVRDLHYAEARELTGHAAEGGFAREVQGLFDHYSKRYVPDGTDRDTWLDATAGIRSSLRDEMIEIYRESRIPAERVAWLIRHHVADLKRQWQAGTLLDYPNRLQAPIRAQVQRLAGLVTVIAAGLWTVFAAVKARPLGVLAALVLVAIAGGPAYAGLRRILVERRRFAFDQDENRRRLDGYQAAFDRWKQKLQPRPDDNEMAIWLDADRKHLIDAGIQHYHLKPSDIITHAVIEAPAVAYRRARADAGPWRYSAYLFLVFLLTKDGVRQVTTTVDFLNGTVRDRQRMNYRFDAVASVRVLETGPAGQTFELTLVNGSPITVVVTADTCDQTEESQHLSEVTLDSTGLKATLHLLEGIAAEGKVWVEHERARADHRLDVLTTAVRDLLDGAASR